MVIQKHRPHRPIKFPDPTQQPAVEPAKAKLIFGGEPSQTPVRVAATIDITSASSR